MPKPLLDINGLNAVLATALDAVVVMDAEGVVRGWNLVAETTLGRTAAEVAGMRMSDVIIPPRYRAAHEEGLARFLATGDGPILDKHIEIEALCADGTEIPVELSITYTEHFGQPLFLGFLRDISDRRRAEAMRQVLIGELNHRVKNLLAVVSSIAHQSLRTAPSLDAFAEEFTGRLGALGRSHEILTAQNWQQGSLAQLAEMLTEPVDAGEGRIVIEGPDVELVPRDFLAMTMIIHEMLTNAVKYGALSGSAGEVRIGWRLDGAGLTFDWRERSRSAIDEPSRRGFGLRMIDFSIRHDLKGASNWDWTREGLVFQMRFVPRLPNEG